MTTNAQRYSNLLTLTNGMPELRHEGLMEFNNYILNSITFKTKGKHFFIVFKDESILFILNKETYVFDDIDEASENLMELEREYPEEIKALIDSFVGAV